MGVKVASRGTDTDRSPTSTLSELLFGNWNIDIEARIRDDNSGVVEHVRPINSVTKGRRSHGFLGSNRGVGGESMVILIAYSVPFKYFRRNGEIYDPQEVNFAIIPEYSPNSK